MSALILPNSELVILTFNNPSHWINQLDGFVTNKQNRWLESDNRKIKNEIERLTKTGRLTIADLIVAD